MENILVTPVAPLAKKKTTKRISDDIRQKVSGLATEGKTSREISAALGISKSSVSNLIKEGFAETIETIETIPEIISLANTEQMNDESFATAILSGPSNSIPLTERPSASAKDKQAVSNLLSKFANISEERITKTKASKQKESISNSFQTIVSAPAEVVDKSILISKITLNVDNFAEVLKDQIQPDRNSFIAKVNKMNVSDLQSTLKLLETIRSTNNLSNQLKYLLYGGCTLVESVTQRVGLKTAGFAQQVRQQEAEIQSCLREIALNNVESYKKVERPEVRLASVLVMTLLATDSRNRLTQLNESAINRPLPAEVSEKFGDF